MGRGLGTILATTGIPLAVELVKKKTGGSAPRSGRSTNGKQDGHGAPRLGMYQPPPPFIGTQERCVAVVKKKNWSRPAIRSQFTVQQHTYLRRHTVKPKFHKNIPMSNHDLLEWCRYLNIPIKSVLARDKSIRHNHQQSLFIYNLEPSCMSGSRWVAT